MISAYFCISAFSAGVTLYLRNIPRNGVNRLEISGCPSHFPLGICHQTTGVAINQPHGIRRITSVILTFRLLSLFHLWFSYRLPGPATSPRCSSVKRTFGSPSHLPLGICHQSSGVSIYPPDFRPFRNFRCPGL
jgi:hypothetical protein